MSSWRIWAAIILLLDAGIGLWNERRLSSVLPPRRLLWIASLEAALALALVVWHFSIH